MIPTLYENTRSSDSEKNSLGLSIDLNSPFLSPHKKLPCSHPPSLRHTNTHFWNLEFLYTYVIFIFLTSSLSRNKRVSDTTDMKSPYYHQCLDREHNNTSALRGEHHEPIPKVHTYTGELLYYNHNYHNYILGGSLNPCLNHVDSNELYFQVRLNGLSVYVIKTIWTKGFKYYWRLCHVLIIKCAKFWVRMF